MQALTPDEFNELLHKGVPLAEYLGIAASSLTNGRATLHMPFRPSHLRPGGTISGPALMSLADATMYAVVLASVGRVEQAVTSNLQIHFLSRPEPGEIIAEGRLLRLGRRQAVCAIELYSAGVEAPVAHVTGAYSLPPGWRGP